MTAQRIHLNEVTFVARYSNIEDLLPPGVESARVEFKASWDENTGYQILKPSAPTNDFQI